MKLLTETVQGFHGRPMHCAKPMYPAQQFIRYGDAVTGQRYRCQCGASKVLWFDGKGGLAPAKARIARRKIRPEGLFQWRTK